MLFCCGYVFGYHSGFGRGRRALSISAVGSALVGVAVALGGIDGATARRCNGLAGGASVAAFVGLWLTPMTGSLARAETPEVSPAGAIGLGNRGWSAVETNHATSANELEFNARAGFATDCIYRGTTLSDH